MSSTRRIALNTLVTIFGDIGGKVLSFVFIIYAARYFQVERYGELSFALSFTTLFYVLSDLGFFELLTREVARNHNLASKFMGNLIVLKTIIVLPVYLTMIFVINLMGYPTETVTIISIIGVSIIIIDSFCLIFQALFRSFEKLEYPAIGKILKNSILIVGIFIIMKLHLGLIEFSYFYLISSSTWLALSSIIIFEKFAKPDFRVNLEFWRFIIKEGLPFWATSIFLIIYYQIDIVMLSVMKENYDVGIYSAAYKFITSLSFIPVAFIAAMFPVTSRLYVSSKEKLKFVFEKSFKFISIISIYLAVIIFLLSDDIINLIYGASYLPSASALKILTISEVILFIATVFANLLNSINRQIICAIQTGIAALLNVLLDFLLIPQYSYIGASFATVFTDIFSFMFLYVWIMKSEYRLPLKSIVEVAKVLITGVLVGLILSYLTEQGLFIVILISIPLYIFFIYIFRVFDASDMMLIRKIVKGG